MKRQTRRRFAKEYEAEVVDLIRASERTSTQSGPDVFIEKAFVVLEGARADPGCDVL